MNKPNISDTKPIRLELEKGTYFWCSCGLSKNQPFCDGSHKTTKFVPLKFEIEETTTKSFCACKQTLNPPFCDGQHKNIATDTH